MDTSTDPTVALVEEYRMWSKVDVYVARHAVPVGGMDTAAHARRLVDEMRAERAVRLLASLDTPEARRLYAELHGAGVLYPQLQPSQPVVTLAVRAVA